ncbi:DNA replication factor Cdt1-like [Symsagittifera roscoffensis]|uniref:DNA replication factor Cdt1-like n=1 Tax=Symsagittifera roscoffensis TaxID=84072 RepID=UPI00307B3545
MPRVQQPAINSHFKECRRSKRNLKGKDGNVSEEVERAGVEIVCDPLVDLQEKPSRNVTSRKNVKSKAAEIVNQGLLNFSPKYDGKKLGEKKGLETGKEVSETLTADSEKNPDLDCPEKKIAPKEKLGTENVKSEDSSREERFSNKISHDAKTTCGKFQKPKSRSAKMLASLNMIEINTKVSEVLEPKRNSLVVERSSGGAEILSNIEMSQLRSPTKRKQQPLDESDKSGIQATQESPRKLLKPSNKDLFPVCPTLPLPAKYELLVEKFTALETSAQMLYNRKERCEFDKLITAVEQITERNFMLSDLTKIMYVLPDAYEVSWEKKYKCMMTKSFSWALTLSPKFSELKEQFVASDMLARKSKFLRNLIDLVHTEHNQYLKSLNPKLVIDNTKIKRWHPKFALEKVVDVKEAELPPKPTTAQPRQGLNELILKTKEKATEKMESALAKIEAMSPKACKSSSPRDNKFFNFPGSSGIPEKLRLKVQAKEVVKAQEQFLMPLAEKEKRALQAKLPEVAKIIRGVFLADKRVAIPEAEIFGKLRSGVSGGMSHDHGKTSLEDIKKFCPEWISIVTVQGKNYVKVTKSYNFATVLSKIQSSIQ